VKFYISITSSAEVKNHELCRDFCPFACVHLLPVFIPVGKVNWKILYQESVDVERYSAAVECVWCYSDISSTTFVVLTFVNKLREKLKSPPQRQ
jgi:hypothetical protein